MTVLAPERPVQASKTDSGAPCSKRGSSKTSTSSSVTFAEINSTKHFSEHDTKRSNTGRPSWDES